MAESLPITDYNYELPDERIARFPLEKRDQTKLLVMNNGTITDAQFSELAEYIPSKSLLIFNNTKVIKARLIFNKPGGARIEIFCLNEETRGSGYSIWKCYVGNSKRWKNQELKTEHPDNIHPLKANRLSVTGDTSEIKFTWDDTSLSFDDILEIYGKVPLPPYLNREPVESDSERYQTIYARYEGSVAAPTAGLHFTDKEFKDLDAKGCTIDFLTLHVGAGTFKPVTTQNALEHEMHEEKIIIHKETILRLISNLNSTIIPVGTTSMRSLESIYWLGYKMLTNSAVDILEYKNFSIDQWEPYNAKGQIATVDALTAIYDYMKLNKLDEISGYTRIMIIPGYKFKICNALITNFHQPQSTLLLLVSAFIGNNWRKAYDHALQHDYRFLSYGDSCLFFLQS